MVYNNPDFGMNDLTARGGIGKRVVPDSQDSDFNIQDYLGRSNSLEIAEDEEVSDDRSFLEKTFNSLVEKNPAAQAFVEQFTSFLEGLFKGLSDLTGKEWSFSNFTEKNFAKDNSNDEYTNDVVNLISTFVKNLGGSIDDNSSEKTSKKV